MTWTTIATDGKVVGNLNFLGDYWQYVDHLGQLLKSRYEVMEAKIQRIDECEDSEWENYVIENCNWITTLTIRKSLRPTVHHVLEIPESESLEGRMVNAYYKGRILMGFDSYLPIIFK